MSKKIKCSDLPKMERCMRMVFANSYANVIEDHGLKVNKAVGNTTGVEYIVGKSMDVGVYSMLSSMKNGKDRADSLIDGADSSVSEFNAKVDEVGRVEYNNSIRSERDVTIASRKILVELYKKLNCFDIVAYNTTYSGGVGGYELTGNVPVTTNGGVLNLKYTSRYNKMSHTQLGGYLILLGDGFDSAKELNTPITYFSKIQKPCETYDYGGSLKLFAKHVIERFVSTMEEFEKTSNCEVVPASPGCHICSEKYCKAYKTNFCKYHQ